MICMEEPQEYDEEFEEDVEEWERENYDEEW